MNLKITALYVLITTCICLAYVNQEVQAVKLSYILRDKEKELSEIIDHNRILLYNNTSLKAPQYLAGMLKQNEIDLRFPDTNAVAEVRIVRKDNAKLAKAGEAGWKTHRLDVFAPKAQAVAGLSR